MSRILSDSFISTYKDKQPPFGANGLGQFVAQRTYARLKDDGKKEQWYETIARCVNGAQDIGAQFTENEAVRLYDHMFNLRGLVAGRCLWQLGVDKMIERFGFGSLVNCYYTNIESIDDIRYLFMMLTLGGGVGTGIKRSMVHEFPKVKPNIRIRHERTNDADFIVPDSREGWAELLVKVLESFFINGKSFSYSTILVRPPGVELATFGGRASGPYALIDGITDICNILSQRVGKKIRSVDTLDIVNIIGRIAVAGSSRRSAIIALGDTDDYSFIRAKNWSTGKIPAWRSQSNNSCYIDNYEQIVDEFWKGYYGESEPYGLVNIDLAKQYGRLGEKKNDQDVEGFNPCAEQILESRGCCNLSTIFLPNIKSRDQLFEVSRLLFKVQKAITGLHHIDKTTEEITHKTRRVGQSITGWMQSTNDQISWVNDTYKHLSEFDKLLSKSWGVPESIRLTTCQPSGCRPWYALTSTNKGILTLEEIFSNHKDGEKWCQTPDDLYSTRGNESTRITKTYDNGLSKTIKVKMSFGYELDCTPNHQWFVTKKWAPRNKSVDINRWIKAEDLEVGHIIDYKLDSYINTIPSKLFEYNNRSAYMRFKSVKLSKTPTHMNEDLAWLIGYLWGDGCFSIGKFRIRFIDEHKVNIEKVQRIIKEQFNLDTITTKCNDRNAYWIDISSRHLWAWLNYNGFYKYQEDDSLDVIPQIIRSSRRCDIIAFFSGLIDSDGGIYTTNKKIDLKNKNKSKNKPNIHISISTADDFFSTHIQHVAWSVGLVIGRSLQSQGNSFQKQRHLWHMRISLAHSQNDSINILAKNSNKIIAYLMFNNSNLTPQIKYVNKTKPPGMVLELADGPMVETFDLEVPEDNWYYAGAFKSHNTMSILPFVTSGCHPAYSNYFIRRVRLESDNKLVQQAIKNGYNVEYETQLDGSKNHNMSIVEFPCTVPNGTILANNLTAIDQLNYVVKVNSLWSDSAVSSTIYYRKEELEDIKIWLKDNYESKIKSVSFLLHKDHGFAQPPYEEIDEATFKKMQAKITNTTFEDESSDELDLECAGGHCPIR